MQSLAIRQLIAGVEAMNLDAVTLQNFRRLVRSVGRANGLQWIEREARVEFAYALLTKRVSRATIRDRLVAHFDISRPHAYRIIAAALQLSQERALNETHKAFNDQTRIL